MDAVEYESRDFNDDLDRSFRAFDKYLRNIRCTPLPAGIEDPLVKRRLDVLVRMACEWACAVFDAEAKDPAGVGDDRKTKQDPSRKLLASDIVYRVQEALAFHANGRDGCRPMDPRLYEGTYSLFSVVLPICVESRRIAWERNGWNRPSEGPDLDIEFAQVTTEESKPAEAAKPFAMPLVSETAVAPVQGKRRRGRPPLPEELKLKALAARERGASYGECAKILHQTRRPTPSQRSGTWNVLTNFKRAHLGSASK